MSNWVNTSFLKFGDIIYCKTPSNTFVPIYGFVETNDIVIDPIPEYFNDSISPCVSIACLACNSFILVVSHYLKAISLAESTGLF